MKTNKFISSHNSMNKHENRETYECGHGSETERAHSRRHLALRHERGQVCEQVVALLQRVLLFEVGRMHCFANQIHGLYSSAFEGERLGVAEVRHHGRDDVHVHSCCDLRRRSERAHIAVAQHLRIDVSTSTTQPTHTDTQAPLTTVALLFSPPLLDEPLDEPSFFENNLPKKPPPPPPELHCSKKK